MKADRRRCLESDAQPALPMGKKFGSFRVELAVTAVQDARNSGTKMSLCWYTNKAKNREKFSRAHGFHYHLIRRHSRPVGSRGGGWSYDVMVEIEMGLGEFGFALDFFAVGEEFYPENYGRREFSNLS